MQNFLKYRSRLLHGGRSGVVPISANTAVCISAVFASVRILSGLLSSLPLKVYERREGSVDAESTESNAHYLLSTEPNPEQTPAVFKEAIGRDYWLFGNSYTEQSFDGRDVESLWIHHATNVEPFRDDRDLDFRGRPKLKYEIRDDAGFRVVDRSQMLHSPALGFDGLKGASVVSLAATSMGIALSGDNLAAQFNTSAAKPFLIVETPDFLDDPAHNRLQRDLDHEWRGDDAFGSMLLEGGATAKTLSIPFKDAQFLESRKFQGEEIAARWFGLPPHLAGYLDRAHFNNVEEQDRALLVFTLMPALARIEQELDRKIFNRNERGRLYCKFVVDALMRPQLKERYEAHKSALMAGWKTVNEIRGLEDLPPVDGGDVLARPASIFGPEPNIVGNDPNATGGEPGGQVDEPVEADQVGNDRSWRSVATDLAAGVLDSLQSAEIHHSERFLKHRDPSRVREWYEQHERRALDRLQPLNADPLIVLDHIRGHRDTMLAALADAKAEQAVRSTLESWNDDPAALAAALTS